jgi:hypothetical protein
MAWTWRDVPDGLLGLSMPPHLNHRSTDDHALTQHLWFETHLKDAFAMPATPRLAWEVEGGVPRVKVAADAAQPIARVQVYYSGDPHALTRFWRSAEAVREGDVWAASCPVAELRQPFFAYANVSYETPARYREIAQAPGSGNSALYTLSSRMLTRTAGELSAAGAKATGPAHERMIDEGLAGWRDWYRLNWGNPSLWTAATRKLKDATWRGPAGGRLAFDLRPSLDCSLVVTVFVNEWGAFEGRTAAYVAARELRGGPEWQTVTLGLEDLRPADERNAAPLTSWAAVTQVQLSPSGSVTGADGAKRDLGGKPWADAGQIRLRNLRWEGGRYADAEAAPAERGQPADAERQFNESIRRSLEQEERDRKERRR